MCNLMNNSIRGLLASSLLLVAAPAPSAWADDARSDATIQSTSDAESAQPSLSTADEDLAKESAEEDRKPAPPVIIECPDGSKVERVIVKESDTTTDGSGNVFSTVSTDLEGRLVERSVAKDIDTTSDSSGNEWSSLPNDLEHADRSWTMIRSGEMHHIQLALGGYAILALEDFMGATLDILVYDQNWNELASFGSDGCGAEFFLRPQVINIVILNSHKSDNAYKLYVVQ